MVLKVNSIEKPSEKLFSTEINNRAISNYPVSIGTSVILESLFMDNKVRLDHYSSIYFNLSTLLRNISQATKPVLFNTHRAVVIAEVLLNEINVIKDVILTQSNDSIKPYFYFNSTTVDVSLVNKIRQAKTLFQMDFLDRVKQTIEYLVYLGYFEGKEGFMMLKPRAIIDPGSIKPHRGDLIKKALICSHLPRDLLSYVNFKTLDLLESNTGRLRTRREWNSKYVKISNKILTNLPFNIFLLIIFGDKVLIKPEPLDIRKRILEISMKHRWTPSTEMTKIRVSLDLLKNDTSMYKDVINILIGKKYGKLTKG